MRANILWHRHCSDASWCYSFVVLFRNDGINKISNLFILDILNVTLSYPAVDFFRVTQPSDIDFGYTVSLASFQYFFYFEQVVSAFTDCLKFATIERSLNGVSIVIYYLVDGDSLTDIACFYGEDFFAPLLLVVELKGSSVTRYSDNIPYLDFEGFLCFLLSRLFKDLCVYIQTFPQQRFFLLFFFISFGDFPFRALWDLVL